jgi:hypothetical protein
MTTHKGFAAVTAIIVVAILAALGGGAYVATHPEVLKKGAAKEADTGMESAEETTEGEGMKASASGDISISWRFSEAGESDGMPRTSVDVTVNGTTHAMGTFLGSCSEVGANGGVDGQGLLAGELSAAQCWFAGGGNEIGVFAHEDGGYEVLVGELSEGDAETPMFRGDFEVKASVEL